MSLISIRKLYKVITVWKYKLLVDNLRALRLHHPFINNDFFFLSIIISMNLHDQFHNLHHTSVTIKLRVSLERERMICTTSYRRNSHDFYFHENGFFFLEFSRWRRFCDHLRIPRNVSVPGNFRECQPLSRNWILIIHAKRTSNLILNNFTIRPCWCNVQFLKKKDLHKNKYSKFMKIHAKWWQFKNNRTIFCRWAVLVKSVTI